MEKECFHCEGPSGDISIEIDNANLLIRESGKRETMIPLQALYSIEYGNYPWVYQNKDSCFRLSFVWLNNGRKRKKDVVLFHDRNSNNDFVQFIKSRYPDQCMIGPNEKERERILNQSGRNVYGLYSLGLLTTLGILSLILFLQIIFLSLSLTTSQFVTVSNSDAFYRAGIILSVITFIPLSLFMLILAKKLMVVKTNEKGLTIQGIVSRKTCAWGEFELGNVMAETSNIYTGLFCYYSDRADVLTSRNFMEIPLRRRTGGTNSVKMSADEGGRFYRELYYRGKVSLEDARRARAFL